MGFKDHFSGHAAQYARARPGYPPALFEFLASHCEARQLAWDCACGNGQATRALKNWFDAVVATDGSFQQLSQAVREPGVLYCQAQAESGVIARQTADLICVAQALHWFRLEDFYTNAAAVLKPGALLAVWCYGLQRVNEAVDAVVSRFYRQVVGPYWPPERLLVEDGYRGLPFPFQEIEAPVFEMTCRWQLEDVLAYLQSWSAVQRYMAATGTDPLIELTPALRHAWGESGPLQVSWPLALRLGRNNRPHGYPGG